MGRTAVIDAPEAREEPSSGAPEGAPPEDKRPHTALVATVAAIALVVLGLAAGVAWNRHQSSSTKGDATGNGKSAAGVPLPPLLAVDPPSGTEGVRPEAKVTVHANRGRLGDVKLVDSTGAVLEGTIDPLRTTWVSTPTLQLGRNYHVTAHILGVGKKPATRTSVFATVRPAAILAPEITPADHDQVGVGAPIVVRFKAPVANRNAVTQGLTVSRTKPVDGAWHWMGPKEIHYRPKDFWPVGQQVTVTAKLNNVDAGNGVWGEVDRAVTFTVGEAHISTVDTDAHTMTVTNNGAVVRTVPQSSGREKYPTMGGIHIVLHKSQHVVMDSSTVGIPVNSADGYREDVYWNVAITNGGEYVHAAPWSTGSQGRRNVSHGCVNLSTSDATWFFRFSQYGDIVNVIGSQRAPSTTDAGTSDWNIPWEQWVQPIA